MMRKQIAVDLGTANTLVFVQSQGIVINEPSVVARDIVQNRVLAVGQEAKEYLGRTPKNIHVIRPLRDGVIADFDMAKVLISHFLNKVTSGWVQMKPDVVICVPTNITDVERRAVAEAATQAGARIVRLIEEPMAAAVGAGLPVLEPIGSMVVDIGGGTTDIAIITLGAMSSSRSIKVAGDALTLAIQRYVQENMMLVIGENMAEKIKINIGTVDPLPEILSMDVSGKDVATGSPKTVRLTDSLIRAALQPTVNSILEAILSILETAPPELGVDIMRQGILLTGGGALLRGFAERIKKETSLSVNIDPEPLTTVLRGAGITLDDPIKYRDLLLEC